MFPDVMTVEQLAQYLQFEPAFVLKKVKKGDIPAAKSMANGAFVAKRSING